jgi:LemA protein
MWQKYKKWWIIGIIAVVLISTFALTYNSLLSQEVNVEEKWGNVQTQYQRRKDLLPNFERTVKAYAEHESSTYTAVTSQRTGNTPESVEANLQAAKEKAEKAQAAADKAQTEAPESEMELKQYMNAQEQAQKAFSVYVNAVHEAYPDLKASENFRDFQTTLEGTENRIQTARADYNQAVKTYNQAVRKFPNVLLSGILGFQKKPMYQADSDADQAPELFQ